MLNQWKTNLYSFFTPHKVTNKKKDNYKLYPINILKPSVPSFVAFALTIALLSQKMFHPNKKLTEDENNNNNQLIKCAHLILPYLTPPELANTALTSTLTALITHSRSLDSSRSLENFPVPFHTRNYKNSPPYSYFLYTKSQLLPSESFSRQKWGSTHRGSLQNHEIPSGSRSELPSVKSIVLDEKVGILVEDGEESYGGISVKLKIVWDERKGWCLFADEEICSGQFVCEYAGEVLTTKEARRRQLIYDELSAAGRFSSALLVVREHLPSGKACFRINIDATRIGNVARFINHSCDGGNLSSILVRTAGVLLPRLCFFASRDIKKGEELTFSYGETRVRTNGLKCFCGSCCCQGTLPSEET